MKYWTKTSSIKLDFLHLQRCRKFGILSETTLCSHIEALVAILQIIFSNSNSLIGSTVIWLIFHRSSMGSINSKPVLANIMAWCQIRHQAVIWTTDGAAYWCGHYNDVTMGAMASQITSVSIVYSTFCLGTDQRKHQSSASLAFVRGIHRWPMNSPHKGPVTRKMFPFDDVIMSLGLDE